MERRALLGAAAAAGPALASFATPALAQTAPAQTALAQPAIASAQPEVHWRLSSSFPQSLEILYAASVNMAKRVAEITDNKFQIRVFAAGEVTPPFSVLDAVQNGSVECGHTASYYYTGKDPSFAFFTALPFGMNTRQINAWLRQGNGGALMQNLLADYNAVGFLCGDTGAQMGGWFRKPVTSLADLQGLKFRVAGIAGEIFKSLGAVPTQVPPSDIYPALERGSLDAVELVGPVDDEKAGFVRVAPYYYFPGFWEPSARLMVACNQKAFAALPASYKAALTAACAEADTDTTARYDAQNPIAMRRLVAQGAQLRPWPREILAAAWKASNQLYADLSEKNPRFAKIWSDYQKFRDDEFLWFRVAENSYDNFAFTAAQTVK